MRRIWTRRHSWSRYFRCLLVKWSILYYRINHLLFINFGVRWIFCWLLYILYHLWQIRIWIFDLHGYLWLRHKRLFNLHSHLWRRCCSLWWFLSRLCGSFSRLICSMFGFVAHKLCQIIKLFTVLLAL